tara:strand:- start:265 stop:849 length:585 start_codon:yes stop_codon:yes gene_type:complete
MQLSTTYKTVALFLALCGCMTANATMVQQMNLGEMTINADKIFRGTVVSVKSGTVTAGGSELPTVSYTLRVTETFKGNTRAPGGKAGDVVVVTMLGEIKSANVDGDIRRFVPFRPPNLENGKEYLLFTTAPSALGLSMTVGVGQGTFRFLDGDFVLNDAKNSGLFRDMDSTGMPERGAIPYSAIAERIRSLTAN